MSTPFLTISPNALPSQSVLFGFGILLAFAYVWTCAPRAGARRWEAFALFGLAGVFGGVGGKLWWLLLGTSGERLSVAALNPLAAGFGSIGLLIGAGLAALVFLPTVQVEMRWRLLDVVVPAGLLGLAVARIGCLLNGCDFGAPGDVPWAVSYAAGSAAWDAHVGAGWISPGAQWSMPTHPFAGLLATGTLVIVVGVTWCAGRARGGTAALVAAGAYLAWRFLVEFVRDPSTVVGWGVSWNIHHPILLMGALLLGLAWFVSSRQRDSEEAV